MSDIAQEIGEQIQTIKQQLAEGAITKDDAETLLLELKNTLSELDTVHKEVAVKYIFAALKTLGR